MRPRGAIGCKSFARALVLVVSLVGGLARAQSWGLVWIHGADAEACLDGPTLAKRVEAVLGRPAFTMAASPVRIEGIVQHVPEGWKVFLALRDDQGTTLGTREHLEPGETCSVVDEPVALILALMVDTESSNPAIVKPRAPLLPVTNRPPPTITETPSQWTSRFGLWLTSGGGQLSNWLPGLKGSAGVHGGSLRLSAGVESWWPTTVQVGSGQAVVSQVSVPLEGCYSVARLGLAHFDGCVMASGGVLVAQGRGFVTNRVSVGPVIDLGLRGQVGVALTDGLELSVLFGARGHLVTPRLVEFDSAGGSPSGFSGLPFAVDLGLGIVATP